MKHANKQTNKQTNKKLLHWSLPSRHLRDVLLRTVELLLQVAGRGLARDFDHGELLVVAGHVAGSSTDAVAALCC